MVRSVFEMLRVSCSHSIADQWINGASSLLGPVCILDANSIAIATFGSVIGSGSNPIGQVHPKN